MDIQERNQVIQIIEEARYNRERFSDLQLSIDELQGEKLKLISTKQELSSSLQEEQVRATVLEKNLRKFEQNFTDRLTKDNDLKLEQALKSSESTLSALRKQMVTINAAKGVSERTLVEREQELEACRRSSNLLSGQISALHETIETFKTRMQRTTDIQTRLQQNIEKANRTNNNLLRSLKHKECIIRNLKEEHKNMAKQTKRSKTYAGKASDNIGSKLLEDDQYQKLKTEYAILSSYTKSLKQELEEYQLRLKNSNITFQKTSNLLLRSTKQHDSDAKVSELYANSEKN